MHAPSGPRAARGDGLTALGLAAAGALFLATGVPWGLPTSKAVLGGLRVLAGDLPYRDFWSIYAPGQFYAVALLYRIFGAELRVQAVATVLVNAASAAVFFALVRALGGSRRLGGALALLLLAALWTSAPELRDYPVARLLLLCAWLALVAYHRAGASRRLVRAGAALGVAAWFKHDLAAYAAGSAMLSLWLAWAWVGRRRPDGWLSPARATLVLGASAAALAAPAAALLALAVGADAWQDLIVFPASDFAKVRTDPFPGLLPELAATRAWLRAPSQLALGREAGYELRAWLLCTLPLLAFLGAAGGLWLGRRRLPAAQLAAGLLFAVGLVPFWLAAHVQQNTHLFTMALASLLLGVLAWLQLPRAGRGVHWRRPLAAAGVALAVGLLIEPAMDAWWMRRQWQFGRTLELPGTRGIRLGWEEHAVYSRIGSFVRAHVPPDEAIYVGAARHDAIVVTDLRIFVVTGRRSATRHAELHPGVTDRASVQRQIIAAIERERVRCVVLWHFGWPQPTLDAIRAQLAAASPDGGSSLLDEYLRREFAPVSRVGEYEILWRRDLPPPAASMAPWLPRRSPS